MARTKRNLPYKHYWCMTKGQMREWIDNYPDYPWAGNYKKQLERDLKLIGTDSRIYSPGSKQYYNRVHRIGRRIERDKLRPQNIDEEFDFDDSRYRARYKGVWWEIY